MTLRKTVLIQIDTTKDEFNDNKENKVYRPINLTFCPDDVILRAVDISTTDVAGQHFLIRTDLISDNYLCSATIMPESFITHRMENYFTIDKLVQGNYYFQLVNDDGIASDLIDICPLLLH